MRTDLWRLPTDGRARFFVTARRALQRRCPYCGGNAVFESYFALREHCPTCGVRFEREEGYFLGAYAFNLIFAEMLGLGLALLLIFGTALRHAELIWQEALALMLAVAFPVIFFPYSRGAWMVFDLTLHPPDVGVEPLLRQTVLPRPNDQGR